MFQKGDWVIHENRFGFTKVGLVISVNEEHRLAEIAFMFNAYPYRQVQTIRFKNLKPAPIEAYNYPEQLEFLINLALDMKDEAWFKELTEKKNLIKKTEF